MNESIICETIKSHLSPDFHVSLSKEGSLWDVDILSPNKTLGAKVLTTRKELNNWESLNTIGRMMNQSFANKAWEKI